MAEKMYRKLGGRGTTLFSSSRLYLGPDHLLKITLIGGAEEYKRFYYTDIQAVIIRRTSTFLWVALFIAVIVALFLMIPGNVMAGPRTVLPGELALLSIPAGITALFLGVHLLLGATCKVVLQTAAHKEPLPSLARLRKARKAVTRLIPLVESAQADIAVQEVMADQELPGQNGPETRPGPPSQAAEPQPAQEV